MEDAIYIDDFYGKGSALRKAKRASRLASKASRKAKKVKKLKRIAKGARTIGKGISDSGAGSVITDSAGNIISQKLSSKDGNSSDTKSIGSITGNEEIDSFLTTNKKAITWSLVALVLIVVVLSISFSIGKK